VTGANGFVGSHLVRHLAEKGYKVRGVSRKEVSPFPEMNNYEHAKIQDVHSAEAWQSLLADVNIVVHLIAKTHSSDSGDLKALPDYRHINVDITKALLDASSAAGVKRFIYLSSIKAVGEETPIDKPFTEESPCHPVDSYGISKREAEELIQKYKKRIDTVIFRPPMIYGPGVKGNFLRLLKAVDRGFPLPFGMIENARSMLYVENLTDAILTCLQSEKAAGQIYHVADSETPSTKEIMVEMGRHMGKKPRLVPVPKAMLKAAGFFTGRTSEIRKLTESLVVGIDKISEALDWEPGYKISTSIEKTCRWFKKNR
jgi:UDP-glucose 4-epimerase